MFLTFETYWMCAYTICLLLCTFYKGKCLLTLKDLTTFLGYGGLVFPPGIWGMEMFSIVAFFSLQMMRLDYGKSANRNEEPARTGVFLIFTLLCLIIYCYFGFFTTYVLMVDIGLATFGIFFIVGELLLTLCAWNRFKKREQM